MHNVILKPLRMMLGKQMHLPPPAFAAVRWFPPETTRWSVGVALHGLQRAMATNDVVQLAEHVSDAIQVLWGWTPSGCRAHTDTFDKTIISHCQHTLYNNPNPTALFAWQPSTAHTVNTVNAIGQCGSRRSWQCAFFTQQHCCGAACTAHCPYATCHACRAPAVSTMCGPPCPCMCCGCIGVGDLGGNA